MTRKSQMTNGPNSICSSTRASLSGEANLEQAALAKGPTVAYWDT
jgi:hypothetical protein